MNRANSPGLIASYFKQVLLTVVAVSNEEVGSDFPPFTESFEFFSNL
ncbi:hypothetical protein B0I18_107220 [Taibaiella chishuiensis]|uniref:Uncharacterized protein n=1 Tax=Taibaiella chishuiensis TaxID=1434707 RepID=A0A2P8D0S4_9BACT|nr:hypothetical protein B0I18_107220 [Taibaiella chishuiensis]